MTLRFSVLVLLAVAACGGAQQISEANPSEVSSDALIESEPFRLTQVRELLRLVKTLQHSWDVNGDGSLYDSELAGVGATNGFHFYDAAIVSIASWELRDATKSTDIDGTEFYSLLNTDASLAAIEAAFVRIDANNNGVFELPELDMLALAPRATEVQPQFLTLLPYVLGSPLLPVATVGRAVALAQAELLRVDTDHDDVIVASEWRAWADSTRFIPHQTHEFIRVTADAIFQSYDDELGTNVDYARDVRAALDDFGNSVRAMDGDHDGRLSRSELEWGIAHPSEKWRGWGDLFTLLAMLPYLGD